MTSWVPLWKKKDVTSDVIILELYLLFDFVLISNDLGTDFCLRKNVQIHSFVTAEIIIVISTLFLS